MGADVAARSSSSMHREPTGMQPSRHCSLGHSPKLAIVCKGAKTAVAQAKCATNVAIQPHARLIRNLHDHHSGLQQGEGARCGGEQGRQGGWQRKCK